MRHAQLFITASIGLLLGATSACSEDSQPSTSTGATGATGATSATSKASSATGEQTSSSPSGATTPDLTVSTEATGSTQSTNGGSTSGASPGTDEVPKACADFPEHFCTQPMDCSQADCGPTSAFSEAGCLRSQCKSDSDCSPEERCDLESFSSAWSCHDDENNECTCVVLDFIDGGYCIPR